MSVGKCRLCNANNGKFAEAHIIPRSFCLKAKGDSKQLVAVIHGNDRPLEYKQNGIWDGSILCVDCEKRFSDWGCHGYSVFGTPPGSDRRPRNEADLQEFVLQNVDYAKLKLFVIGTLWRASVTSHPFFSRVDLGPHEATIGRMIQNNDPGPPDQYPVIVFRLTCQSFPNAIFPPWQKRFDGINFNILYLPSIRFWIKVDQQPLPAPLLPAILQPRDDNFAMPIGEQAAEKMYLRNAAETVKQRKLKRAIR